MIGCYRALYKNHIPTTFIDTETLAARGTAGISLLYLPYSYALNDQSIAAIRNYVRDGGTVWADGLLGWKNQYGDMRAAIPGGLGDVFGLSVNDIDPVEKPFSVTPASESGGELWRLPIKLTTARILLPDLASRPFATVNRFGKGAAIYYGSAVTLAEYQHPNATIEKWIAQPAIDASAALPLRMLSGSAKISFRGLQFSSGKFVVLSNWGPASEVTLQMEGQYRAITSQLSSAPVQVNQRDQFARVHLSVPAKSVVVLRASTK